MRNVIGFGEGCGGMPPVRVVRGFEVPRLGRRATQYRVGIGATEDAHGDERCATTQVISPQPPFALDALVAPGGVHDTCSFLCFGFVMVAAVRCYGAVVSSRRGANR